ncbi:cbb3-type cytochrome c oxidase subunit I [Deinococcus sp. KSM4-11]|uniref:cytochrome c oxidase subunit I n=1 Tax=Deinococcus sp. KSM4-11 TaxID=2568654 RepID=UPI001F104293|nr:cbb3-type cytochrome c oxidase subunit I [Deinococcus sp. KSM4-11]
MTDAPAVSRPLARSARPWDVLTSTDHKSIGLTYMGAAAVFLGLGGLEALVMRVQLAVPGNRLLSGETYDRFLTMHGTTMIFFVLLPLLLGFTNYLLPLQLGARDMAFPRLNALSLWLFVGGGVLLYLSPFTGAPSQGWFSYAPLSETGFTPQRGVDLWSAALIVSGYGTTLTGVNVLVTGARLRARGMLFKRMPMFAWMTWVNGFIILFALPCLTAVLLMLEVDRLLGAGLFTRGDPVLWQHYFWLFGHPEIYLLILPAWGLISEIIPVFSRKPIFGYEFVAWSTVAIAFLSFAVYAHHMFAVGLAWPVELAFGMSSMLIAIPTGIKVFNWLATMWKGSVRYTLPMLYAAAFIVQFTFGGVTGVSFAVVPIDWQLTDTYYVVAHFHYVLFGGSLFAALAGLHYLYPKITGRFLNERLGRWGFWLNVVGFNGVFLVQHLLGLMGMPRRVYTYPDLPGWGILNLISTVGGFILGIGLLVLLVNLIRSRTHGEVAGRDPWNGWTLEWLTQSPPAEGNFALLPPLHSRRPLWDLKHPDDMDHVRPRRHDKQGHGHIREEERGHR